jgi:hypothetical protein
MENFIFFGIAIFLDVCVYVEHYTQHGHKKYPLDCPDCQAYSEEKKAGAPSRGTEAQPAEEKRLKMPCSVKQVPLQNKTQRAAILRLLIDAHGAWVPCYQLSNIALQYNSRVWSLRRLGYNIENRAERVNGERHSWFRLVSPPPKTQEPSKPDQPKCSESGYMKRRRQEDADALPLFAEVQE